MITSNGIGVEDNWSNIVNEVSSIREIKSFDSSRYRGIYGGEAIEFNSTSIVNLRKTRLDRASLFLIHTVREALTDAKIINSVKGNSVLISLGTTLGGMLSGQLFHTDVIKNGLDRARVSLVSDYLAHYQPTNLFREFELNGDSMLFSNACASGTNAIGYSYNCLRSGEFNVAICGGYDTMSEFTFAGFNSLMAVSPTLCRPFDRNRDGLVLGEGAGILILEELNNAIDRGAVILAEVIGYGESADAYHMTSPDPSGKQSSTAINNALKIAGYPEIDYINAHGTGTKLNDIMETSALRRSFGDSAKTIPVSSIKPMIGHLLGGAGAVEAIVSILAIQNNILPANLNYDSPDPECGLNIVRETANSNVSTVLSNSFGFGGVNASLIFREYSS